MALIWGGYFVWRIQGYTTLLAITYPIRIVLIIICYVTDKKTFEGVHLCKKCNKQQKTEKKWPLIALMVIAIFQTIWFVLFAILFSPKFWWGLLDCFFQLICIFFASPVE